MAGVNPVYAESAATRRMLSRACIAAAVATVIAGCGAIPAKPAGAGQAGAAKVGTAGTLSASRAIALATRAARRVTSMTMTETFAMHGIPSAGAGTGLPGAGGLPGSATFTARLAMQLKPDVRARVSLHVLGQTISEILTPQAIFIKVPGGLPTNGKPWAEIKAADLPAGASLSTVFQKMQSGNPLGNPSAEAKLLAGAEHLRVVRAQVVRGVRATEYVGTLRLGKFLSLMPAASRKAIASAPTALRRSGLPFRIWIDAQHRVRKLILSLHFKGMSMRITMNVTSINKPVRITAPPASEVSVAPAS